MRKSGVASTGKMDYNDEKQRRKFLHGTKESHKVIGNIQHDGGADICYHFSDCNPRTQYKCLRKYGRQHYILHGNAP
jgi:hypothetical protein